MGINKLTLEHMNASQFVLGCDRYGYGINPDTAFEMIDMYKKFGGNILDTARLYAYGNSEKIVGSYLEQTGSRNRFYISTKCAHPKAETMNISRLSRDEIYFDVEKSLECLKTDYIDILWLHRDDTALDVKPIIDTLNSLIDEGIVKCIGASNWTGERIKKANEYANQSGQKGFCASQILYNMAKTNDKWDNTLVMMNDDGETEFYKKEKIPVFAFSSQAKGFFEKYNDGVLSEKSKQRYLNDENVKTFEQIKENAEKHNTTISYEALDMLIRNSTFDVFPIIGPSNIKQLMSTLNVK